MRAHLLSALLVAGLIANPSASAQTIDTYAGDGTAGYTGDSGPARNARVNFPHGMATDRHGNLYFADRDNHVIRRVSFTGTISTFAGVPAPGFSGDGGDFRYARFNQPRDVAFDNARGVLYVADRGNNRIRKLDMASWTVTTVAGTGEVGFSGDGEPATQAKLSRPFGVAVDSAGNLIIADTGNNRIRMVGLDGIIWTIGGNGLDGADGDEWYAYAAAMEPFRVDVAPNGEIYFTDWYSRVRRIDLNGIVHAVAGSGVVGSAGDGGPALAAALDGPDSMAWDAAGNLYFAESFNSSVRKVDRVTGTITRYAGTGVRALSSGDGGPASSATLEQPMGLAIDVAGRMFISDFAQRIRIVTTNAPAQETRIVANYVQDSAIVAPLKAQIGQNLTTIAGHFEARRKILGCVGVAAQATAVRLRTAIAPYGGIPRRDGVTLIGMLDKVRTSNC